MVLGNCPYLHELYRLISSCVIPDMVSLPNPGLNDALDSQEQTGALLPGAHDVALDTGDQQADGSKDYYGPSATTESSFPLLYKLITSCAVCIPRQSTLSVCRGTHGSVDGRG